MAHSDRRAGRSGDAFPRRGRRGDAIPRRRRAGLSSKKRTVARRSRRRTAVRVVLLLIALLSASGLAGVGVVYATYQSYRGEVPSASQLTSMEPPSDSYVFDRDGNLIDIIHGDQRHTHVDLAHMSRWVRLAIVDTEDRRFYEEASWDLPRIVKAGWDDLRHNGTTQGASTITQQLAKVSFLGTTSDRSISRKAKQVILGIEIEGNFSKDQILEMYLNRIEFGNHSIGIEAAAETYFHKHAVDLDLAEASMLAGLPNSPVLYNPLNHADGVAVNPLAVQRQHTVLALMVSSGDITQAQADAAGSELLSYHSYDDADPPKTAFTQYVRQWLQNHFGGEYLNPGGWRIDTTLNPPQQALAERTLAAGVAAVNDRNAHDGALVGMDPRSGEIYSMVGTVDPTNPDFGQFNAAISPLQPGSTIKLFTYTAAIASRQMTMKSPVLDAPLDIRAPGLDYRPLNYDRAFHGTCELQKCLGNSFNVPAVKVEQKVGISYITDLEIAAGLTSLADPSNRPCVTCYAATLGGLAHGVAPLELADGVSTIASLGIHHEPTPVRTITVIAGGQQVYSHDPASEGQRVVDKGVAFIISQMASNDNNRLTEFGPRGDLTLPDRRVAAKTGTTENFVSNWTVGWTPDLVTVVWVGNVTPSCLRPEDRTALQARLRGGDTIDDPFTPQELAVYNLKPSSSSCGHLVGSTGITGAAPIFNSFMRQALVPGDTAWYTKPDNVLQDGTGNDAYYYLPGTEAGSGDLQCAHYGPQKDPGDPCQYTGSGPYVAPPPAPPTAPSPSPGAPAPPAGAPTAGAPTSAAPVPPPGPPATAPPH